MTLFDWICKFRPVSSNSFGWISFQIGLFFLSSSVFLSGLFLLFALLLGGFKRSGSYWRDLWNYPFLIVMILMIISSFQAYSGWLAWAGLVNWLPWFWGFWSFQAYLQTAEARRRSALCLLAGTFPLVVTGLGQLWLGWHGPWQILNGLIIWFVAPGGEPLGRLSGLFSYANIAGAWLAMIWPFALAALLQRRLSHLNRSFALILAIGIVSALVLTDSRNAWGGLILAIPFVLGPLRWIWLLPLLVVMLFPVGLAVLPGIDLGLQEWARKLVPENIWARLSDVKYMNQRYVVNSRLFQWNEAIKLVFERPWLGWGAAAFSLLYVLRQGTWLGHAHNFPLEIAISHGIPVATILVSVVMALLIVALQRGVLTVSDRDIGCHGGAIFDRAWWGSCLVLVSLHSVDMPLFDGRLNMAGWVLLAGLRCLIIPLNLTEHSESKLASDDR